MIFENITKTAIYVYEIPIYEERYSKINKISRKMKELYPRLLINIYQLYYSYFTNMHDDITMMY